MQSKNHLILLGIGIFNWKGATSQTVWPTKLEPFYIIMAAKPSKFTCNFVTCAMQEDNLVEVTFINQRRQGSQAIRLTKMEKFLAIRVAIATWIILWILETSTELAICAKLMH